MIMAKKNKGSDHQKWWNKNLKGRLSCDGQDGYCERFNECYECGSCKTHCHCKGGPIKPSKEWPEREE